MENLQFRYIYRNIVFSPAANHLITSAPATIVLHHITDMIHKGQVSCFPTQKQLVEATGLPRATLNRALTAIASVELIGRISGTGGRHTTYWMMLPQAVLDQLPTAIVERFKEYIASVDAKHGTAKGYVSAMGHRDDGSVSHIQGQSESHARDIEGPTYGTVSVSSSETHNKLLNKHSNEPLNEPTESVAETRTRASLEAHSCHMDEKNEVASPLHEPLPPLPAAGHKQRAMWGNWPSVEPLEVIEGPDEQWRWNRITSVALEVLGYPNRDIDSSIWGRISDRLKSDFEWKPVLLQRYSAGMLSPSDIASVMVAVGIDPPVPTSKQEDLVNG